MSSHLQLRRLAADHAHVYSQTPTDYFIPATFTTDDLTSLSIMLVGPTSTPYEHGLFRVQLHMPPNYPLEPPKASFRTKLWHPNVDERTGEVCVDVLKAGWRKEVTLVDVLSTIRSLLIHPNPSSALNAEAGILAEKDFRAFTRHARLMTKVHAPVTEEYAPYVRAIRQSASSKPPPPAPIELYINSEDAPPIDLYIDSSEGEDSASSSPVSSPSIPSRVLMEITDDFLPDAIVYRPSPLGKRTLEEAWDDLDTDLSNNNYNNNSNNRVYACSRKSPKLANGRGGSMGTSGSCSGVNVSGRIRNVDEEEERNKRKRGERKVLPLARKGGVRTGLKRL